jgi:hypothetical protein
MNNVIWFQMLMDPWSVELCVDDLNEETSVVGLGDVTIYASVITLYI